MNRGHSNKKGRKIFRSTFVQPSIPSRLDEKTVEDERESKEGDEEIISLPSAKSQMKDSSFINSREEEIQELIGNVTLQILDRH